MPPKKGVKSRKQNSSQDSRQNSSQDSRQDSRQDTKKQKHSPSKDSRQGSRQGSKKQKHSPSKDSRQGSRQGSKKQKHSKSQDLSLIQELQPSQEPPPIQRTNTRTGTRKKNIFKPLIQFFTKHIDYNIFMKAKKYEARKQRFTNLDKVTHMDCIGKDSVNGTIFKLTYDKKDNMQSNAILKSSKNSNADSLVYEYEVGQFINKQCRIFPCFLETYGLFFFKDKTEWTRVSDSDSCSAVNLHTSLVLTETVDYEQACENSKHAVIIIQNIETTYTLRKLMEHFFSHSRYDKNGQSVRLISVEEYNFFWNNELLFILIQVFFPLSMLHDVFTHYDLHDENVLIYKLPPDQYVIYEFTFKETTYRFKTRFIAKIIDYGRCYFNDKGTHYTSMKIYEKICAADKCNKRFKPRNPHLLTEIYNRIFGTTHGSIKENCGNLSGFKNLRNKTTNYYHIDSTCSNCSHDLRLMNLLKTVLNKKTLFKSPKFMQPRVVYETVYGTPAQKSQTDGKVYNVMDLFDTFLKHIDQDILESNYSCLFYKECIGTLHIDGIKPMTFTA